MEINVSSHVQNSLFIAYYTDSTLNHMMCPRMPTVLSTVQGENRDFLAYRREICHDEPTASSATRFSPHFTHI